MKKYELNILVTAKIEGRNTRIEVCQPDYDTKTDSHGLIMTLAQAISLIIKSESKRNTEFKDYVMMRELRDYLDSQFIDFETFKNC